MIVITEQARAELKKLLTDNQAEDGALLRLTASDEGQLGLVIDSEQAGDDTVEYEGAKVFAIESKLAGRLDGVTLDVEDTPEGPMLMLRQESCGGSCCGSSCSDSEQECAGKDGKSCCS
jgi:Fe-S cluster assembly iron-binding protein IscA